MNNKQEQVGVLFRPHHFLCALCFQGYGYNPTFTQNFVDIMSILNVNEDTVIEVTPYSDDICGPCPYRQHQSCQSEPKIQKLDQAHRDAIGFKTYASYTWKQAKARIKSQLTLETFHRICEPCEWKKSGLCESILKDYLVDENID